MRTRVALPKISGHLGNLQALLQTVFLIDTDSINPKSSGLRSVSKSLQDEIQAMCYIDRVAQNFDNLGFPGRTPFVRKSFVLRCVRQGRDL